MKNRSYLTHVFALPRLSLIVRFIGMLGLLAGAALGSAAPGVIDP